MRDPGTKNGLHVIIPPHFKVAQDVDLSEMIPPTLIFEARDILQGIRDKAFCFPGSAWPDCFAMAQPQVSENPLRYFVLNDGERFEEVVKAFGGLVIVNPHLVSKNKETRFLFKDACMSYPFRPHIKVKRYREIVVSYDIIQGLEKVPSIEEVRNRTLTGNAALVFMHELEHLNGKSIYS